MGDAAPHAWPRFLLDGEVVEARDATPTTTLLQYLRGPLARHGTKEGCAEGDCGACTVVVGEPGDGRIRYRAVNACIRFVGAVDGCEVVTAESLRAPTGELHPVQQAMVDCHASQCGFCTPGFVMSLFAGYLEGTLGDREAVLDTISGNLCRCTGYRPIVDAGVSVPGRAELSHWSRADAQSNERRAALDAIQPATALRMDSGAGFDAPRTLDALADLLAANPEALLLAGGTDVGLWVTQQMRELPRMIFLGNVPELVRIDAHATHLDIGAAVDLERAYAAIVAEYPSLAQLANRFASVPIRNAGTLCGNVANGSPIGDSMPVLIALGATVLLRRGTAMRELPMEALYLGYQRKALLPGEFVAAVRVPRATAGVQVASYKISKRFEQDISAVCAGIAVQVRDGRVASARIAFGGMAPTPKRALQAEAALVDEPWTLPTVEAAMAALGRDYDPISDMRASAGYRRTVAANLLKRFFLEHAPLGEAVSVFADLRA